MATLQACHSWTPILSLRNSHITFKKSVSTLGQSTNVNILSASLLSVLVEFIHTEAKACTDPSFKLFIQFKESRRPVDPNKHCSMHKNPHPLQKCRGFIEKSIEDHKQLLKDHYICFCCCSSTKQLKLPGLLMVTFHCMLEIWLSQQNCPKHSEKKSLPCTNKEKDTKW